ncbi:MAG TPA: dTMP kinase [Planctomycetota bacterium]|nr:dTMP kinase [Planctomycetota bacterium]
MKKAKSKKRGRFIVIDGPDGAGKTTHAKMLADELTGRGIPVKNLREPGGTALGEAIRGLVLDHGKTKIGTLAETFLFEAARAQLIGEVIRPALDNGEWIVCDRFALSTLVYQGYAGGIRKKAVKQLSATAIGGLKPDAYFVLWVPAEIGAKRRADRPADRIESKGEAYLSSVFKGFHKEAKRHSDKYTLIDGRGAIQSVRKKIWKKIESLLK